MTPEQEIQLMRMVDVRQRLDVFEAGVLKELEKTYKSLTKDLMKILSSQKSTDFSKQRAAALLEDTKALTAIIANTIAGTTAEAVGVAGSYSYAQMNDIVSWDNRVEGFNAIALSAAQITQLVIEQPLGGKTLQEWMGSAFLDIDTILPEIQKGYVRGEAFAKITSRIDNILMGNQPKQHIESVVKTYIQSMNVKAQQDVYEANKGVVKKVEWSALMEGGNTKTGRGTCPRCQALDGQQWIVDDYSRPNCPLHVRCRCLLSPITLTWRELGFGVDEMEDVYKPWTIRVGKQRDLDDYGWTDDNYADWWKSRSKEFQNSAIGPRRADLVRSGAIEFQDIIDNKGNLIPIRDL